MASSFFTRDPTRAPPGARSLLACATLPLLAGALFWVPALGSARGFFPVPLDDVYIHHAFARSFAQGHPFEWMPGNGYSSGETAPLYAVVLAAGWLIGFRGPWLGVFGAAVAVLALAVLVRAVHDLVRPSAPWLAWGLAAVPFAVPLVDWTLFSGMEVALFAGALGGALIALDRTGKSVRAGATRETWQLRLGAWGAALVLLRPEAVVVVLVFAVGAARAVGPRSALLALGRAGGPGALAAALLLGANHLATGDPRAAGAQLKLLSSNPFLSETDRARAFVENLVVFAVKVVQSELWHARALAWILPALVLASLTSGRRRRVAAACVVSALGWTLLASWNGNSPFHNFRYYAPALLLVLVAAALGASAIARFRRGELVAALLLAGLFAVGAPRLPVQTAHFRTAVANIRDQQIEVGTRLRSVLPRDARVLVGDAGAIPYVSERRAVDALGLGGYLRMPFARAAVHGEPAMLELIERLEPAARPTHLALYPNWFPLTTARFGEEIDRVTIENNLICGGPTKGIYRADWSALAMPTAGAAGAVDELDVADVVSEAEHGYVGPWPAGGWTTLDVRSQDGGPALFDGGRIVPEGARERFVVRRVPEGGRARIRLRIDTGGLVRVHVRGAATDLVLDEPRDGHWRHGSAVVSELSAGDEIVFEAARGEYRNFHVWIEAATP
jgi:hypothetical protein